MAFTHYTQFTVASGQVPSTQTNHPVLINHTAVRFKTTGNGGNVANSNGYDVRPYSDAALTAALTYELERYDGTGGEVVMWINIASLADGSIVYLAYGDAALSSDGSSTSTWEANFKGVWHLKNGTTLTTGDSTSNALNATAQAAFTVSAGTIDGGAVATSAATGRMDFTLTDF